MTLSANSAAGPPRVTVARWGVVLLAAGQSARMGQPKQLLHVDGRPLVVRAAEEALASEAWPVIVVVGAHANRVKPALIRHPVLLAENPAWEEGMASSIRTGLATLECFSRAIDGVVVALCDQPGFSADSLRLLVQQQRETGAGIVAARYLNRLGAPALFTRRYFPALHALNGDEGARHVIVSAVGASDAAEVPLPELGVDLDTPEDYRQHLAHPKGTP